MTLFNAPDSSLDNLMKDLALSRKMEEQNHQARAQQLARIRGMLQQEQREYRQELDQMRRTAEGKVNADIDGLRDRLYALKQSNNKDTSGCTLKVAELKRELERLKEQLLHVNNKWQDVASRSVKRGSAVAAMEFLMKREEKKKEGIKIKR